ncbi:amino acid permease [Sphingomonas limnosediminicola]|jgi:APA family basic amino acid/polyamine antiporter|uniref:Arginine/agmatine antiporter n=1 Tax=Sphingomonas limnosediminicola TaxID=940133 RepID=A0ABP7LU60_9SPHN
MTEEPVILDANVEPSSRMLGKWMSAAMVVGSMVGSGIYLLPTTLAPFGSNLVIAFLLTGFGTMCLAFALARLAARIPGGPFAYVDQAFGEKTAFVTLWCYTFSQVTGVSGVAVAVAGALGHVWPSVVSGPPLIGVALCSIFALLIVNLRGTRSAGALQIVTVVIKLVPLLAVMALVLGRFGSGSGVEPLAAVPLSFSGVIAAAALTLFSLTGFEGAAMTARVTRDSTTTVPRATILGTGFTAVVYLLATVAVLLLLPSAVAAKSGAPFADAISPLLGATAGIFVALIAAVSAFGTANSLLLMAAETARTMGQAGDLPPVFARANGRGAPAGAIWICSILSALLVLASSSKNFVNVYVFITLVSTVLALVLYIVCAAAALKLRAGGKWTAIVAIGVVYSIAMFIGSGVEVLLWGAAVALAGLPIRAISRWLNGSSRAAAESPASPLG